MTTAANITIEPLDWKHVEYIQAYASDKAVSDTTANIVHPYPPDGAKNFIRDVFEARAKGLHHVFAITVGGSLVGVSGLVIDLKKKEAEIGYWIGRPFWRRGYATQGSALVLRFGFEELMLQRVIATCLTYNIASYRVMEKNGFQFLGTEPRRIAKWNREEMMRKYELLKSEWERRRA